MKILIPTCLSTEEVAPQIAAIMECTPGVEVFASCLKASASVNRNRCLLQIEVGDTAIMLDDDVSGYYPGWADDLLKGLEIPGAVMVSARLLNPDGTFGQTCSRCYKPEPMEIEVKWDGQCALPTAAIAFVRHWPMFDECYRGSGWEDNDWCRQYAMTPEHKFIQSNRCRLVHANLMREQRGANWEHNKIYFRRKWGING